MGLNSNEGRGKAHESKKKQEKHKTFSKYKHMKILHIADLHLGQIIYQNYDRIDEHQHFFNQLKQWCVDEKPDALVVSGDIFDIQQPSSTTKKAFNDYFVDICRTCPEMKIVIVAGNHDSASRIQADSSIWGMTGTTLIGTGPITDAAEGWEEKFIVRIPSGYIIAMPFLTNERTEKLQHILDVIAAENTESKPVVMTGHTAVTGLDITGHDMEIGKLKTQGAESFGNGFDYLALGHIHKPQTIGHQEDAMKEHVSYPAPVIRYSGSVLHVSCDETYPHSVSLVHIDKHGGTVDIKQLRIDELRHFYVLPADGSQFTSADDAINAVKDFCRDHERGYIRLRVDYQTDLPANFNQEIYEILSVTNDEIRYNPKVIWEGNASSTEEEQVKPTFEVAELQQMTDPMVFIEKTINQYPTFSLDELRTVFEEVEEEIHKMAEEKEAKDKTKKKKKKNNNNEEETSKQ